MTKVIITTSFIFCVLNSFAQEFGTHWICHPISNDSTEVFFCHTYISKQRPQQASLTFASSGKLRVYVNERNISPEISYSNKDTSVIALQTYDVTRFLYPDSNTIAIWFAPTQNSQASKQLSLEYYGTDDQGKAFYHAANEEWKCQILKGSHKKGNNDETFDRRSYTCAWKSSDCNRQHWSQPLGPPPQSKDYSISANIYHRKNNKLARILSPVNIHADSLGVTYDFGRNFIGTIRLTLRGALKGERIQIGSFTYICTGSLDEQAFRYFTTSQDRRFVVRGDEHFKKDQINNVEALEYE